MTPMDGAMLLGISLFAMSICACAIVICISESEARIIAAIKESEKEKS